MKTKFEEPVRHLDQYLSNFCQTQANFTGFAAMSDTFRHLWEYILFFLLPNISVIEINGYIHVIILF